MCIRDRYRAPDAGAVVEVPPFWKLPREIWCRIWDEVMKQHGDYFANSEKNSDALEDLRLKVEIIERQLKRIGREVQSKMRRLNWLQAEKSRLDTLFCEANYAICRELSTEGTKTPNWAMHKKKREMDLASESRETSFGIYVLKVEARELSVEMEACKTQARFVRTWTLSRLSKHI